MRPIRIIVYKDTLTKMVHFAQLEPTDKDSQATATMGVVTNGAKVVFPQLGWKKMDETFW